MTDLSREAILGAVDLKTVPVQVPEWGGTVYVRSLSGREREQIEYRQVEDRQSKDPKRNFRGLILAFCLSDAAGKPLFTAADAEMLGAKAAKAVERVFEAALKLNGFGAGDVEELEKNS